MRNRETTGEVPLALEGGEGDANSLTRRAGGVTDGRAEEVEAAVAVAADEEVGEEEEISGTDARLSGTDASEPFALAAAFAANDAAMAASELPPPIRNVRRGDALVACKTPL